jgi:hypothetical protein
VKPTDYAALLSRLVRRLDDAYAVCVTAEKGILSAQRDWESNDFAAVVQKLDEIEREARELIEPALQLIKTCADRAAIRGGRETSARSQHANVPASATQRPGPSGCVYAWTNASP